MSRAALLLALALAALPAAASAAVPPALGPDGRVYPLLGGGARAPRDGLPATQLRVGLLLGAAALADGSVAVLPFREEPFAVAPDGRVATLPEPPGKPEEISALVGAPDGALLALRGGGVLRLGPDAADWAELPRPPAIPASFVPDTLLPLPAGYALVGRRATWRVEGGTAARASHPPDVLAATAAPDGTIVLAFGGSDRLLALPPGAPARELRAATGGDEWIGLLPLPAGDLLGVRANSFAVDVLAGGSTVDASLRPEYGLGTGDGGPFEAQGDLPVAIAPDGAVLLPGGADNPVRLAVPPGSTRTLAAVAPATYAALRRGEVTISSTFAGAAGIAVRSGGEVVTSAIAAVGPGETTVPLPDPPPPGTYTVAVRVTATDGREARHRMRVVTLRRLSRVEALREARRYERRSRVRGLEIDLRRCERAGTLRFSCQALAVERRRGPDRRRCAGIWFARLRPDGLHSRVRAAPKACRERGPVR